MIALDTRISGGDVLLPDGVRRVDLGLKDGKVAGVYAPWHRSGCCTNH